MSDQIISQERKPIDENGYPIPKWVKCFQCEKEFCLTFSFAQQNYSRKHFWFYWTEKEEDKGKFIDNFCLRNFYLKERKTFLATIKSLKKRNHLRTYISHNIV